MGGAIVPRRGFLLVVPSPVYLDNHATTRPDPAVLEAMWPYFTTHYGNPASAGHRFGWEADAAVERAREQVAALVGAEPREVVFTSGATEANNLAIKGVLPALRAKGDHLITAAAEHKAVLDPLRRLAREGWRLTILPVDARGRADPAALAAAMDERTVLVSLMAANNEVGTIAPIADYAGICRERGVLFHTDATQAVGKIPLDFAALGLDLLSLSAHKFHGPKGIGALIVRRGGRTVRLAPLFDGGGHERGLRSGTPAVPLIVGLGVAAELARERCDHDAEQVARLRDRLQAGLLARLDGLIVNGDPDCRLPGNLHISVAGLDGEALMMGLRDVAVSSGAACTSAERSPSHVLAALGIGENLARASLRFGVGRYNTEEEIDFAIEAVAATVERLRGRSSRPPAGPPGDHR